MHIVCELVQIFYVVEFNFWEFNWLASSYNDRSLYEKDGKLFFICVTNSKLNFTVYTAWLIAMLVKTIRQWGKIQWNHQNVKRVTWWDFRALTEAWNAIDFKCNNHKLITAAWNLMMNTTDRPMPFNSSKIKIFPATAFSSQLRICKFFICNLNYTIFSLVCNG